MTIAWDSSYSIGCQQIDIQHQELFRRFNALDEVCRQHKGQEEIIELYEFLDAYVVEHFTAEEELMKSGNYPETEMHFHQHQIFKDKLGAWKCAVRQNGTTPELLEETLNAMVCWMFRHIRTVDGDLGVFLNRNHV